MRSTVALVAAAVFVTWAGSAAAMSHDIDLSHMVLDKDGKPWDGVNPYGTLFKDSNQLHPIANQDFFKKLSSELGLAIAPAFLAPAKTLGHLGFDIGVEFSVSDIHESEDYWNGPCGGTSVSTCKTSSFIEDDKTPRTVLSSGRVHIRKGLPFSFELGGTATYLFYTEMAALGMELKWAVNEGFYYIPDFSVRGSVTRLFGSKDLDLTMGGFDITISKTFGVGGTVQLSPYGGYNFLYMRAASYVLDATPKVSAGTVKLTNDEMPPGYTGSLTDWQNGFDNLTQQERDNYQKDLQSAERKMYFSFNAEGMITHREFVGFMFKTNILTLAAEAVFAELPSAGIGFIWQVNTKIGLDF
ncbi:MAG: hypothetical protein GXP49_06840 [Deltaproteobacteria bacterium]|nr:hypothetical protein [Deltaproteobacteria bacterium]